jgi:hypothetical protein
VGRPRSTKFFAAAFGSHERNTSLLSFSVRRRWTRALWSVKKWCTKLLLWVYSPLLGLGHFLTFLILYIVWMAPCTGDHSVVRLLPSHRTTQTQNTHTQTFRPWMGFEPTSVWAGKDISCFRLLDHTECQFTKYHCINKTL